MKQAVMLFAEGYEEVEALMTADILLRGGVDLKLVSITDDTEMTGSHGITVQMDLTLGEVDVDKQDAVILPGGMPGTLNLGESRAVTEVLQKMAAEGKVVGAICAAPSVLGQCGILKGKRATCYPGFEEKLEGAEFVHEMAVADGNIITSRGLGTAMEFGFLLVEKLVSREKADEIREQIVFMYPNV